MTSTIPLPLPFIKTTLFLALLCGSTAIEAAAPFDPGNQPLGSLAPMALSTTNLYPNGAKAYRTWFENGAWQGDIVELDVSSLGIPSSTVDLTTTPPTTTAGGNWSARIQFDAATAVDPTYWTSGRKIATRNASGVGIPFRWGNLSATQQQAIDPAAYAASAASSDIVDFIRGDRGNEKPNGGLRQRFNLLGDIIHSPPTYVAAPIGDYTFDGYTSFKNNNTNRPARLYVGANDGMLHAFDAATGDEVYAYIPSMVVPNLKKLSSTPYSHVYFVDGQLTAGDFYDGTQWKSVLVGGLGAGGKGIFILDITSATASSESDAAGKILWELDGASDADLGYTYSRATIVKLNDNKWYAVFGNGYNSANGKALLYLLNLSTGAVTRLATDNSGSGASPNGLSTPALIDVNKDFKADFAFAGDIDGNLWKFDLTSGDPDPANWASTPADWNVAYSGTPLIALGSSKPIIVTPDIVRHPNGGFLVYFGTGRLFTDSDRTDTTVQSMYGIWDTESTPAAANLLTQSQIEQTYPGEVVRTSTDNPVTWTGGSHHTGWQVDLPAGERVLTAVQVRAGRAQVITHNPTVDGGENWLLEPNYLSGGAYIDTIFDLNHDDLLNTTDRVDANADGDLLDTVDIPIGWFRGGGFMSRPIIARVTQDIDTTLVNSLIMPFTSACTDNCTGGFQGGHVDVDTDSPSGGSANGEVCAATGTARTSGVGGDGLSGTTDGHQHEYDKAHGQVYSDYFDLEPLCDDARADGTGTNSVQKLNRITEVGIGSSQQFYIILANADLSPGGTITVGNAAPENVVDYQNRVLAELAAGTATSYTLNQLQASGGTLRIAFDDRAIIDGGLVPTVTGCVRDGANHITNGRWRNGALTIQLLDKGKVDANPNAIETQPLDGSTPTGAHARYPNPDPSPSSGLLYESTMFWHYGKLYKKKAGAGELPPGYPNSEPCYGEPFWEEAVLIEQTGITYEEYLALWNKEIAKVAKEQAKLDDLIAQGAPQSDIDKQQQKVNKAQMKADQGLDYVRNGNSGGGGGSQNGGVPNSVFGVVQIVNPTPGPNFSVGRRTWIEIEPQ